jgi:hypothetical protein
MANRYWVGGTGTWDNLALLKWSTTSGGLGGSAVPTSADTVFFDANSGANTVTIGAGTAICSTLTMTGFTGTLAFGSNSITCAGSGANTFLGATTYSVTGTPLINITGTGTLAIAAGAVTEANSISFTINNAASNQIGITGAIRNLTFAGSYTGTLTNSTRTIYGNLTFKSGMTLQAGGNSNTLAATSGTQTITSAALTLDFPINLAGTATYRLADDLSVSTLSGRNFTLTSGTLDLNDKTLTIGGAFISSNTNTRSVLFGTNGKITLTNTGTATVLAMATATNFTYTGTSAINLTGDIASGITRTVQFGSVAGATESNALNFTTTAGQVGSIATFPSSTVNTSVKDLIFTTGFAGALASNGRTIFGNFTCSSTMSHVSGTGTTSFSATSGTQQITLAGTAMDSAINLNGTATYSLQDAFATGGTKQLSLSSGTLQTNGYSVACGNFSYTGGGTKALNLSTSIITILGGSGTTGWVGSNTGTTYTSVTSSTIIFTTTGFAAFSGGQGGGVGNQFGTVTMSGLGGTLYLGTSGGQTVARCITLNNTVSPCTITNSCTTGFTVTNFNVSGTAGNLVTFNSNTAGTARTINQASGTVNAYYLNIQDSNASGGAVWYANSSINGTNNTGWNVFNNSFLMVV